MNFLSWNVCGLIDLPRKYFVRDTKCRLGNINVLCLQEVKFYGFLLDLAYLFIWLDGVNFASQHEAGQGGVFTLLFPWIFPFVISHGSDPMQRIALILLSFQNIYFGIVNVYAPNDAVECSHLWRWLTNHLPPATWYSMENSIWLRWLLIKWVFCLFNE